MKRLAYYLFSGIILFAAEHSRSETLDHDSVSIVFVGDTVLDGIPAKKLSKEKTRSQLSPVY